MNERGVVNVVSHAGVAAITPLFLSWIVVEDPSKGIGLVSKSIVSCQSPETDHITLAMSDSV